MLHILWLLIKFILIVLAVILGLVLLAVLLVLFCPVRYQACGVKEDPDIKKSKANVRISWLFRGISVSAGYEGGAITKDIRIFGISLERILGLLKKKSSGPPGDVAKKKNSGKKASGAMAKKSAGKTKAGKAKEPAVKAKASKTAETSGKSKPVKATEPSKETKPAKALEPAVETKPAKVTEPAVDSKASRVTEPAMEAKPAKVTEPAGKSKAAKTTEPAGTVKPAEISEASKEDEPAPSGKIKGLALKVLKLIRKIAAVPGMILEKLRKLTLTIRNIYGKIEWWKNFLTHPRTKAAVKLVFTQAKGLVRHVLPTRTEGNITFGCADPSITGTVLALLGMTIPYHKNCIAVTPRFDGENFLEGEIRLKGRIYGFVLVKAAIMIYFNKNIKYVINRWKHKEG